MGNKIAVLNRSDGSVSFKDIAKPVPSKYEVLVKHSFFSINELDLLDKNNQNGPEVLGYEGCGIIESVGEGVKVFNPGDRVSYVINKPGSYCEYRAIDQNNVIRIPSEISMQAVSAYMFNGFLAHTLMSRAYILREGASAVIHNVTSGIGQVLVQFAKYYKAKVIGTVKDDSDHGVASGLGCVKILNYNAKNVVEEVHKVTSNRGVHAVFDGVGKETINLSLKCLSKFGVVVLYGFSNANVENVSVKSLYEKSLFVTAPYVFDYKSDRGEIVLTAAEVMSMITEGVLNAPYTEYGFENLQDALNAVEQNKLKGIAIISL